MAELLRIEGLKQYYLTGKGVFKKGYVIKAVDDVSFSLEQSTKRSD